MLKRQAMVITGDHANGFAYFGPFDTLLQAEGWAHEYVKNPRHWCVVRLYHPADTDTVLGRDGNEQRSRVS